MTSSDMMVETFLIITNFPWVGSGIKKKNIGKTLARLPLITGPLHEDNRFDKNCDK